MDGKLQFKPLNDDHAIQSVKFALIFTVSFTAQIIAAVERAHDQWREGLPAMSSADINVDNNGRSVKVPGVYFAFLQPDASANWSMHIAGNRIEIECSLYSRWNRVWETAFEYFRIVMDVLNEERTQTVPYSVELTVKDVFLADRSYNLEGLFERTSPLMPSFLFSSGDVWHCNTGWFDKLPEGRDRLGNLNCEAVPLNAGVVISISHLQRTTLSGKFESAQLSDQKYNNVKDEMNALHVNNKKVLTDILNPEVSRRIGLAKA